MTVRIPYIWVRALQRPYTLSRTPWRLKSSQAPRRSSDEVVGQRVSIFCVQLMGTLRTVDDKGLKGPKKSGRVQQGR
jgi:hypothetical protein